MHRKIEVFSASKNMWLEVRPLRIPEHLGVKCLIQYISKRHCRLRLSAYLLKWVTRSNSRACNNSKKLTLTGMQAAVAVLLLAALCCLERMPADLTAEKDATFVEAAIMPSV